MAEGLIAVIDDEDGIRQVLSSILHDEGYATVEAIDGETGLELLAREDIDVVILDVWLPGMDGLGVLKALREKRYDAPVIMVSGHGTIDMAVQAVKGGAYDFLEKPLSMEKVLTTITNAMEIARLRRENRLLRSQVGGGDAMVGESVAMRDIRRLVAQAAATSAPVFISGENGTGKELVARSIHKRGKRANGPFIAINCAAIPETLLESELFGHEKGAFTGAIAQKKGRFELANGGTLFLDEVADLSPAAQVKLLRVLQEMCFERVGGEKTINVDVRVIAATNRNIREAVQEGTFREDLFYRLHVFPVKVPALKERKSDIPLLVSHFFHLESELQAIPKAEASKEALDLLVQYDWPGNVRQLRNMVQRLLAIADGETVDAEMVQWSLDQDAEPGARISEALGGDNIPSDSDIWKITSEMELGDAKDAFERMFLFQRLQAHGYNVTRTAESLGMYPSNLHAKIRKFNLER